MKDTKNIKKFLKTVFARKVTVINAIIVLIFIFLAIFAPFVAPYDPDKPDFAAFLQLPSAAHVLGTDNFGRDVLSRIIYGTRVSLIIGVLAVVVACAVGTVLGMIAGYFGGWIDDVITRLMEAVRAIPQIILAMALTAVFGSGIRNLAIILGISSMAGYVRMMRGQVLTIKQADYIMAGKLQTYFTKQYFTDHRYDDTAGRFHYPGRSRFKLPGTWYQRSNGFLGKHGK